MLELGSTSFTHRAYALMRIVSGSMFAFHGMQKLFGILTEHTTAFGSQIWIGGVIEFIGGLAVAAGWLTRPMAVVCSGTMAVAYVQFHWKFRGGTMLIPTINEGELALLYAFVFLYIANVGAGIWSVDRT